MKRWAFNIIAGASLALAVLTAGLWVRSYWVSESIGYHAYPRSDPLRLWFIGAGTPKGDVLLFWNRNSVLGGPQGWRYVRRPPAGYGRSGPPPHWQFGPGRGWADAYFDGIAVRCWALVLLFSLAPAAWLLRGLLLRRRRVKRGLCPHCGYDLRATPDRCPECGREPVTPDKKVQPQIEHGSSTDASSTVEHLLSPDVLATASLRGREFAWPPASVEKAINDARQHGRETFAGVAQFRLPDGTCELYWLDLDPSDRKLGEPWEKWVDRSADEAIAKFRQRMARTDWYSEIQNWPFLRARAEAGIDVMSHLCFVLYFGANPSGQAAAVQSRRPAHL